MRARRGARDYAEILGVYLEPTPAESVRAGSLPHDTAGTVTFVDDTYIDVGAARPILSLAYHAIVGEEETMARLRQRQDKVGNVSALPPFSRTYCRRELCARWSKRNCRRETIMNSGC
jgi:hypothetical protein